MKGEFKLAGEKVNLKRITMPVLNIFAQEDHIIPPKSSQALKKQVGTKDYTELQDVLAVHKSRTTLVTAKQRQLTALRDELPIEDRTLLILRVDRKLSFDEIALAFAENPETFRWFCAQRGLGDRCVVPQRMQPFVWR